jgi:hypothetical protein
MADAIDELDKPRLTLVDLQEFLELDEDIPVTLRQLREAVLRGELVPTKLSNRNYFSKRDGLDWLAAQRGKYRGKSQSA